VAPRRRGRASGFGVLDGRLQLVPYIVLLACGFEPFSQRAGTRADVLNDGLQESCVEAVSKLRDGSDIIGGPSGFAPQVFEFGDIFVKAISDHFDLQEFLVGSQLFLAVREGAPEVSFKYAPKIFIGWQHSRPILRSGGKSFNFFDHSGSPILNILSFYVGQDESDPFEGHPHSLVSLICHSVNLKIFKEFV
jgi:hypothetical protein